MSKGSAVLVVCLLLAVPVQADEFMVSPSGMMEWVADWFAKLMGPAIEPSGGDMGPHIEPGGQMGPGMEPSGAKTMGPAMEPGGQMGPAAEPGGQMGPSMEPHGHNSTIEDETNMGPLMEPNG